MIDRPSSSARPLQVAVVVTVLNEADTIRELLHSLEAQTRPPDEVVVVDGGSTDETMAILESYRGPLPLRVLQVPGANISQGRNAGIKATQANVIACTDAGVRLAPDWLEHLVRPWVEGENPPASAGFFVPDPRTPFELALAATTLPLREEIRPERFLPSSRSVAFTRQTWLAVDGYPEWLSYSEDIVFDLRVRGKVGEFAWAPDAIVYFRPRPTVRAFFRQYRNYAYGDGQADLWRRRHAIRYATYLGALPALVLLGWLVHPLFWALLAIGGMIYCRRPWWRLKRLGATWPLKDRIIAFLWVPFLRAVGDVAKMIGYPQGLLWRWRHRHDPQVHWRRDLRRPVYGSAGGRLL